MNINKLDFVKLTTEGYPIELHHSVDEFYDIFIEFINKSNENNFFAELNEGVVLHAGMRTEVCKMAYDGQRVVIYSKINDTEYSSTGEFTVQEELTILGHACLGILYFCDLYAGMTGQNIKFSESSTQKSDINNNTKYDVWPL